MTCPHLSIDVHLAELLLQRGYEVSHETIRTWEFRFAPMVSQLLRAERCGQAGRSWYLDETYVNVCGAAGAAWASAAAKASAIGSTDTVGHFQ